MSAQFGNQQQQPHSAQWNVPPGAPGNNLPPNPQIWNVPTVQPWNPPASYQWNNPANTVMTQSPAFHQEFLKGKPKSLGVILIVVGILHIGMGIGQLYTSFDNAGIIGIPFWGAIFNFLAGSLSVAAVSKPSMCLIKGSLGLSIVVSISSVTGLILNIVDLLNPHFIMLSNCYYDCSDLLRSMLHDKKKTSAQATFNNKNCTVMRINIKAQHKMSLQVNNGNQQTGIQVLDQMDPPPYHCIAPSCYPTYIANIPAASPAWNNYNVAPQSITSANLHQWNVHPPSTVLSMPQSQNDFPQNTDLILFQEAFRKGKPKVTGGVLVVLAFLQAGIGIGFLFTIENFTWKSYISFWGLMFYIFTGTLTIRTREKVKIHQVKCSLTFSILTTLISLTAMILISIDYTYTECYFTGSNSYYQACLQNRMPSLAVLSVMFVLNLVLFCVSISISAFSCRALCNLHTNSQVFILYNGALYPMSLETIPSAPSEFSSPHLPPPY